MADTDETAHYPGKTPEQLDDNEQLPLLIGRYHVRRILGKGGFGVVYLAMDEQLQRSVAIKVPHKERISSSDDAAAYLAEARTVANLDHPNIVPVHDVGNTAEYPCFIVSKYIQGATLSQKLESSRPTFQDSAELIATIAEAIHYAHRKNLVHRDIKPSNILIDETNKPFVVDFGLALKEENLGKGQKFAGTPAYMSPEQARGEGHRVDGRSDIFSLGIVFYEMLLGRRPFKADTQAELLEQITNFEPRPPRQVDDGIPKELERICLKALSKRASDRYTTAKDMAEDLRHFLGNLDSEVLPKVEIANPVPSPGGKTSQPLESSDLRSKVVRGTYFFADFKGFTERVRILEKTAGPQAAAEMKRKVASYIEGAFDRLKNHIDPANYSLIDTAGDGFFYHFRIALDAYRIAESLNRITGDHNSDVADNLAEHKFRTGASTGEAAWDGGKPVGHVVNTASRLQSASMGGDFVIDRSTFNELPLEIQKQFGPPEVIRDKHAKSYDVYRTAFGDQLVPLPALDPGIGSTISPSSKTVPSSGPRSDSQLLKIVLNAGNARNPRY